MKKKLSLSKKTLRNLSVRSGVNTGGSVALTDGCSSIGDSIVQTADCPVTDPIYSLNGTKPIRSVPPGSFGGTFTCSGK
jgi:hypothetical protein